MIYVSLVLFIACFDSYVNSNCAIYDQTIDCNSSSTLSDINNLLPTIRNTITTLNYAGTKDTKLPAESFELSGLQSLYIHDTNIQQIQEEAFANIDLLSDLTLEANKFYTEIKPKTFLGLAQLIKLTITKCPIQIIKNNSFEGVVELETLNLQENQIHILEINALKSLSNLKYLLLNDNQIKELPMDVFIYKTPKLIYLDLHNNIIEEISAEQFTTNTKQYSNFVRLFTIESLNLAGNQNFRIQPNNFVLLNLIKLDLSFIGLSIIPQNEIFGSKLEHLTLDLNNLTELTNNVFYTLINLKTLSIRQNLINSIDENSFRNMNELMNLDLSENQISELSKILFKNLTKLEYLNLYKNRIKLLKLDDFEYLKNLKTLNVRDNKIIYLLHGTFNNLKYLNSLIITGNEIVMIQPKTFENLLSLTTLDLSANKLQTIDKGVFDARNKDNYSKLETLIINYNDLTRLGNDSFLPLTQVTELDLSLNKIMEIELNTFRTMEMLEIIKLRFNLLETIPYGLFTNLLNLKKIDLHGNRFKILPDYIFSNLQSVKDINLNFNNLIYLSPLAFKDSSVTYLTVYFNNITFIEDEFFINSQLKYIIFDNNPIQCKCYFEILTIAHKLNINHGYIQTSHGEIPVCTFTKFDTCVKDPNLYLDIFKSFFHTIEFSPRKCVDPDLCY